MFGKLHHKAMQLQVYLKIPVKRRFSWSVPTLIDNHYQEIHYSYENQFESGSVAHFSYFQFFKKLTRFSRNFAKNCEKSIILSPY